MCGGSAEPLVAVGLVTGQVLVHRITTQQQQPSAAGDGGSDADDGDADGGDGGCSTSYAVQPQLDRPSKKGASCRALVFLGAADEHLGAGFETGTLLHLDAATGKAVARLTKAHAAGISRLLPLPQQPALLAAGDEDGGLRLWDLRAGVPVLQFGGHTDFITGLALEPRQGALLAVSGDGTLSAHDLRARQLLGRSESDADDELLSGALRMWLQLELHAHAACILSPACPPCKPLLPLRPRPVAVVKRGRKVVVGSQSGVLGLWSWGYWADCSDRFPGHPESVDALVAYDDDTLITGSSDGALRIINVLPNKLLGVLGEHAEGLPVERLALSGDKRLLASTSHDNAVKLWDLSLLADDDDDAEQVAEGSEAADAGAAGEEERLRGDAEAGGSGRRQAVAALPAKRAAGGSGDDSDSDSDDEGGAGGRKTKKQREKTAMRRGSGKPSKPGGNFFADLL